MTVCRAGGSAVLVVAVGLLVSGASTAAPPDPAGAKSPSPSPSPTPPATIAASVDRVVREVEDSRLAPCRPSAEAGVPCFTTAVEAKGSSYSVADYLRQLNPGKGSGPEGGKPGITIDPVCKVKSILKKIKKKNDTYYLYRVWDRVGEHAVMREQPFDPNVFEGIPEYHFELLGKVSGECAAVAAFQEAEHKPLADPTRPGGATEAPARASGRRP